MLTAFFLAALPLAGPQPFLASESAQHVTPGSITRPQEPRLAPRVVERGSVEQAGVSWGTVRLAFDEGLLAELFAVRAGASVVLGDVPLPTAPHSSGTGEAGRTLDLELERFSIAARGGRLVRVDGEPLAEVGAARVALFTGGVVGLPGSDVFLAATDQGTRGWVRLAGTGNGPARLVHLIADPGAGGAWALSTTLLVDDGALGLMPQAPCQVLDLPDGGLLSNDPLDARPPQRPLPQSDAADQALLAGGPLRELTLAIETDHQLYQLFGTTKATQAYVESLIGAVAALYRNQLNVAITVPYLGLYSAPTDPWFSQDLGLSSIDLLYEFRSSWYGQLPVEASLAHFLSGANLGGGVAWLDALCRPEFQFGVSGNLGGNLPFPVMQGPLNWDFIVVAHELGHNVATPHTHDFCPPIDECAPDGYFGACQNTQACLSTGTLMSYCHTCDGGVQNIQPGFHPQIEAVLEARIDNSCLPPYEGLFTTNLGGGKIGAAGVPEMTPTWTPEGDLFGVDYIKAPVHSAGAVVVSTQSIGVPLFGGILWPSPDLLVYFPTPTSKGSVPPFSFAGVSFPAGLDLVLQTVYLDPLVPSGLSGSDGWEVEIVVPTPPSPLTWIAHPTNGKQYALTPPGTWHKGQQVAREHGGEVASLDTAALELWLRQTFFDSGLASGTIWIGMTDETSEGSFFWVNGTPVTHSNFGSGQPDDWQGYEDYASWSGGPWNDLSGYEDLPALIER